MALVTRDPFAREELHRTRVVVGRDGQTSPMPSCQWCGGRRMTTRTRTVTPARPPLWLYRFRVETDGGRTYEDKHLFCSRACRESYNA